MYSLTKEKGILVEKVLYVNSNDRDVNKWPKEKIVSKYNYQKRIKM